MKSNPEWAPFIEAVKSAELIDGYDTSSLEAFIGSYPKRLRAAVALALSVAKWYWLSETDGSFHGGWVNCGCCVLYHEGFCGACPLVNGDIGCIDGTNEQIYNRVLKIYAEHFNKLPARDRQEAR